MELKKTIAYPASFWMVVLTIPLYSIIQIVFLETIYSNTSNFAGYTKYEGYILFGTFSIVQTIGHLFFHLRLADLKGLIRGGGQESFDTALVKPLDAQILTTIGRFNFGNIAPLFIAIFIVLFGLSHEPSLLNIFSVTSYVFVILMGVCIFYLTFLFISTFLFWFPELQMVEALWEAFLSLGQYPSGLYHGLVGVIFNLIIPITLMASIPVEFLLGRKSPSMLLLYLAVVVMLFILTRLFWNVAIKKYSSFSS
jgi:ABC-2 type transport system permease protein